MQLYTFSLEFQTTAPDDENVDRKNGRTTGVWRGPPGVENNVEETTTQM